MTWSNKWRRWALPSELRRHGILGINYRNLSFIFELNPRLLYPRVDNKVLTKRLCEAQHIPVPKSYVVIERFGDIAKSMDLIGDLTEFVVKPARGAAGRGVLMIVSRTGSCFVTSKSEILLFEHLKYHVSTILSGLYSLAGQPDQAIVEKLIAPHPVFKDLAVTGTPDIRIILYRAAPVMAMLRLPTRASRGRANLHQGAVGVGIDLQSGQTFSGVWRDRRVDAHPDTGARLSAVELPDWSDILSTAVRLSEAVGLGYMGVDIVLDAQEGPMVLEANARPGLSIQIANMCGLQPRLTQINAQPQPLVLP